MAKPSPLHSRDPSLIALGETIREERKIQGISQEALAFAAGIDRSYLGGIERGQHNLTLINLLKIAAALKVKPADLLMRVA